MAVPVKICGLTSEIAMAAAVEHGAAWVGLVFYPPSPRSVTPARAAALAALVPPGVGIVGLTVDLDAESCRRLTETVPLTMMQLHGRETPETVQAIAAATTLPVMKAIRVATATDIDAARAFMPVSDWLLFDAKPPGTLATALPGGNALCFDWTLLAGRQPTRPWMLAGGLTADRVADAVALSGAPALDVSSAVESAPGVKDPARIRQFLAAARAIAADRPADSPAGPPAESSAS